MNKLATDTVQYNTIDGTSTAMKAQATGTNNQESKSEYGTQNLKINKGKKTEIMDDELKRDQLWELKSIKKQKRKKSDPGQTDELPVAVQQEIDDLNYFVPEVKNHFSVLDKIGEGTFSSVFLASLTHPSDIKEKFALKHIIPTSHPNRMIAELKCLQLFGGRENVMGVELCLKNRDHVVIIMRYFPHQKFMEYFNTFDVSDVRDYMKNLLIALKHIHQFDIIHRDVKPTNFLHNTETKKYALVDFGLAQDAPVKLREENLGKPPILDVSKTSRPAKENNAGDNKSNTHAHLSPLSQSKMGSPRKRGNQDVTSQSSASPHRFRKSRRPPPPPVLPTQDPSGRQRAGRPQQKTATDKEDHKGGTATDKEVHKGGTAQHKATVKEDHKGGTGQHKGTVKEDHKGGTGQHKTATDKEDHKGGTGQHKTATDKEDHKGGTGQHKTATDKEDHKGGTGPHKTAAVKEYHKGGTGSGKAVVSTSFRSAQQTAKAAARAQEGKKKRGSKSGGLKKDRQTTCVCYGRPSICNYCSLRPVETAHRAGTPGFRAPEVLMKHPDQTTAVDIWAAGIILLSLLSGRYPFFRGNDDMTCLSQILSLLGTEEVKKAALTFDKLVTSRPETRPLELKSLCERLRAAKESNEEKTPVNPTKQWTEVPETAVHLLKRMLDPNPATRITAEQALACDFFKEE